MSGLSRTNILLNTVVVQDDKTIIDSDVTVVGALTANDVVVSGVPMTTLLPYVNDQATKTTIFAATNASHNSFGSMNGADNNNTMQDLSSDKITVARASALKVFKSVELPNGDVQNGIGNVYPHVCDEEHLYVLATIGPDTGPTSYNNNNTILYKFNKWSGEFIMQISFATIFGSAPFNATGHNPTPPSIVGDYLYLMHPGNLQFAKLDKNFNVKWMKNDVYDLLKEVPEYYKRWFGRWMPKHGSLEVIVKSDGTTLICLGYCHVAQYGYQTDVMANFTRNFDGVVTSGGVYCVKDLGTTTENKWLFRNNPVMLKTGDRLPAEALAPGASSLRIAYPIVAGKTAHTRVGPYESCNLKVFNSVGSETLNSNEVFRFDANTAGYQKFITFDYSCNASNLRPSDALPYFSPLFTSNQIISYSLGPRAFNFSSNDTIVNDSNVFYYSTEGSNYKVSGADIFIGQTVVKRLASNVVLNEFDAYAANYYGCSVWGKVSYDSITETVYVGVGQPHKRPLEDYFIASNNDIVFSEHVKRYIPAHSNFLVTSNFASMSNEYNKLTTRDFSTIAWQNTFSPRANRVCGSGIVALNINTGALNWKYGNLQYDDWNWGFFCLPSYTQWPTSIANADVVSGVTITTNSNNQRILVFGDKINYITAFPASNNFSITPSSNGDLQCDKGVASISNVSRNFKTMVGFPGTYGGISFGGTATNSTHMAAYVINVSIGSGSTDTFDYYPIEKIDKYNSNIGWVVPNGLIQSNVLTDARVRKVGTNYTLVPTGVKYVTGVNFTTGSVDYYTPLQDHYLAFVDILPDVPYAIENYPITMVNDVAMVGNGRGNLIFLDGTNGTYLKHLNFTESIVSAFACDNVVYTLGGAGSKWAAPRAEGKTSRYIRMITPYGL